ncbi:MAG TPA: Vms1/Ankzf1 family peptidyl-tRNA hydrolase [Solirubrobacteraceae bacterium]|jgi:peptide subunit release factor 1 (eRF1)|nr:Vms1/Ankzf1 family peptidyl-tRNA hydrolase [Solirubrobacteraceae bacterium]
MPVANDLDEARLRRLAELRDSGPTVLSLYLNLDPDRFATPRARSSEIDSLLDAAHREIESEERPHEQLTALRSSLERAREILQPTDAAWAQGARSVALFLSAPLELEELLRLERPVSDRHAIGDVPFIEPLTQVPQEKRVVIALVDERIARFMRTSRDGLREALTVDDEVWGRQETGGWSQARYQRGQHEEVRQHIRHVADVLKETQRVVPFDQLLIGCPEFMWNEVIDALHPEVRRVLHEERLTLDVPDVSVAEVERAVGPVFEQERAEREEQVLAELRAHLGREDGRAAAGLEAVLSAVFERRVATLLYDEDLQAAGVRCPHDGWLGLSGERCPFDGTATEPRESIVDDAVRAAVDESAEILALRERPELGPLGGIAATLRF